MTDKIEELQTKLEQALTSITKLEGLNGTLKQEVDKYQSGYREAKREADEARTASEALAEAREREAKDVEALEKRLTAKFQREIDGLKTERDRLDGDLRTVRVDNEIARAIADGNVRPEMVRAVTAMMKAEVAYADGIATIDGKPVADHVAEYLSSKEGAHFVRPADNSGGGASGGTSTMTRPQWTKEEFLGPRSQEAQLLARDNPPEYNSLVKQLGLPESLKV